MSGRAILKYSQLALVASDQAYFDNSVEYQEKHIRNPKQYPYLHLHKGDALAPLVDVPRDAQGHVEDVNYRNEKNPLQTNGQLYQNTPPFAVPRIMCVDNDFVSKLGAVTLVATVKWCCWIGSIWRAPIRAGLLMLLTLNEFGWAYV